MPALLDMNTSPGQSEQVDDRPKAAMRFTYPSGSRPLDGYTIKRGVGRGGFGEVYFAVSDAGKEVALKLIRRNLEVELRGVTQCLNLKHPNLIDLYDIRTDENDDRWVVMEYVSGESLEDLIQRHPQGMPRETAVHWFEGICAAVAYLHDHGIVHRDLKPANIFIDEAVIKIGDYGLSKFISCSRRSGQTESVGTVHYMAPEIANGRYGREIDAYALGIILYEMLTGHVPFEGESVGEVLMKHLTAEPDLSALVEPYRGVVRAAMAKDPEHRINNAAQMAAMLHGGAGPVAAAPAANGSTAAAAVPGSFDPVHTAPPAWRPTPRPWQGRAQDRRPESSSFVAFFHRQPEPVWTGFKQGWQAMIQDLRYDQWTLPGRFAFASFVFIMGVFTSPFWLVALAVVTAFYVVYRIFRVAVQLTTVPPTPTADPAPYASSPPSVEGAAAEAAAIAGATAPFPIPPSSPASAHSRQRPWRRRAAPAGAGGAESACRPEYARSRQFAVRLDADRGRHCAGGRSLGVRVDAGIGQQRILLVDGHCRHGGQLGGHRASATHRGPARGSCPAAVRPIALGRRRRPGSLRFGRRLIPQVAREQRIHRSADQFAVRRRISLERRQA